MTDSPPQLKSIIFIDDDHGPMDRYEQKLERAGYKVKRIQTAKDAFDYVDYATKINDSADLWVVDIMMSVGKEEILIDGIPLRNLTDYGLTCGLQIVRRIRAAFANVPVILLTSITTPEILDSIEFGEHTRCHSKLAVVPSELVKLVNGILRPTTDE
jgi:DNA-binding response OmpR family regulator